MLFKLMSNKTLNNIKKSKFLYCKFSYIFYNIVVLVYIFPASILLLLLFIAIILEYSSLFFKLLSTHLSTL